MEIAAVLVTFVAALSVFLLSGIRFPNDDQFIFYRYIDNVIAGNGLVYNIGERVMGFTAPLFTLLGVFGKFLFPSVYTPTIVSYLNIILLSLAAGFFYRVCNKFVSAKMSFLAVLVFAFSMSKAIPEGMETPLFILAIFAFFDSLLNQRYYVSAVFLALAILTRPDAGLVAVLAFIFWWQKAGFRRAVILAVVSVAVALPWLVFSTIYFGSFIPQSLVAKLHTGDIVNLQKIQAFKVQLANLSRTYWGKIFDPENIKLQITVNLLPFLFLVYLGIKKRINSGNWIIFAVPFLYFVSFSVSNPVMFPWYTSQLEPIWIFISFLGMVFLLDKIKNFWMKTLIILLIIAGPVYWWAGRVMADSRGTKVYLFNVGNYIKENIKPGETVGVNNIGIIGFVSNAYIFDFFGIVNDVSPAFYPVKDECADKNALYVVPPTLIKYSVPDWLVFSEGRELVSCFRESDWFRERYDFVYNDISGNGYVWKLRK